MSRVPGTGIRAGALQSMDRRSCDRDRGGGEESAMAEQRRGPRFCTLQTSHEAGRLFLLHRARCENTAHRTRDCAIPTRRGVSSVLAMMFLVIFGSLAIAMAVVA